MRTTSYAGGRTIHTRASAIIVAVLAALTFGNTVGAVDVFTDPVGFLKVTCLSNSDTFVSIPFHRAPTTFGVVQSISGNVITVSGNPNFSVGQFTNRLSYAFLASGMKEGASYTITNNGANTVSVELVPEDLSNVANGDRIKIIPFWTLGTAFPGGAGATPSIYFPVFPAIQRKTEVFFPDIGATGINLSAAATYFYLNTNGLAWRKVGAPILTVQDDQIILPDQYFIVRQSNQAPAVTNAPPGYVPVNKLRIPLYANVPVKQDNFIGLARPASVTLDQSGLTNNGAFLPSLPGPPAIITDELLTFDNTVAAKNKSAAATYRFFTGQGWRKVGSAADFGASNVFLAGTGSIIRKQTNATPTRIWSNTQNY